jgi:hypothetical protein
MKKHPDYQRLALFAGGDLDLLEGLAVRLHVSRCAECSAEVEAVREACADLRDGALAMPEGVEWESLAADMKANIRLGLAAGAIVGDLREPARRVPEAAGWRVAVVMASLAFVAVGGWYLRTPRGMEPEAARAAVVLDASPGGLAVQQRDGALTLLSPKEQPVTTTVSWGGGAKARYIDSETGQVTIHHVYAE